MTDNEPRPDEASGSPDDASHPPRNYLAQKTRRMAEAVAKDENLAAIAALTSDEARTLLYELRVHQIQLEMQNEELRSIQGALTVSRARYFDLYDLAPVGYFTLNEHGLVLEGNLSAAGLLGVGRSALMKKPLSHFILREDQDIYYKHRRQLSQTGAPQACELRMVREGGDVIWARLEAAAAVGDEGMPIHRVVLTDITARKGAEEALQESEAKFRGVFEQTAVGMVVTGLNKVHLDCNTALLDMLGLTRDEFLRMGTVDFTHPDEVTPDLTSWEELVRGERTSYHRETRYLHKNGQTVWVRLTVSLLLDGRGQPVAIVSAVEDITDRKRTEAELRESQALTDAVVENAPLMIFLKEATDLRFVILNRAGEELLGYDRKDVLGKNSLDLFPAEQAAHFMACDRAVLDGETDVLDIPEEPIQTAGKGERLLHTRRICIRGADGITRFVLGISEDITDRKRAEASARMATVGHLAAGIAHDFNNILGAMMMRAELLGSKPIEPKVRALVDTVLTSGRRGAEICKNLMGFARPDEPRREPMHIEAVLEASLTVAQMGSDGVGVRRDYGADSRCVHVDSGQMEEVFLNLFINARHAMPEGGTLSLTTRYDLPSNRVVITVADTGHGIPPENLPHIFVPFFTTKGRLGESETPGAGLGLAVSHSIIAAHDGEITVRSEVGAGTTFAIQLPFASADEQAEPGSIVAAQTSDEIAQGALDCIANPPSLAERVRSVEDRFGSGRHADTQEQAPDPTPVPLSRRTRILLADDELSICLPIAEMLQNLGHTVVSVLSTREALEALEADHFDLIISDRMMPGGGARKVLEAIAVLDITVPVIVITGRLEQPIVDELMAAGAAYCLQKPFTLARLQQLVAEVLPEAE